MVDAWDAGRGAFFRLEHHGRPNGMFWAVRRPAGRVAVSGLTTPPPEMASAAWGPMLRDTLQPLMAWAACMGDARFWAPCGDATIIRYVRRNGIRSWTDPSDRLYTTGEALEGDAPVNRAHMPDLSELERYVSTSPP
jgi:hypothetical protein